MAETLVGIKPLHSRILVGIYDDGDTVMMLGGKKFFLLDDSSADKKRDIHVKHQGVRPRWAIVLAVADQVVNHGNPVKVGQKVLLDELKWSRGVPVEIDGERTRMWSIPVDDVLLVGEDEAFSEMEREQITRLYKHWETWESRVV
jgi:hypothetical protein